jgi:hypothetical protein
MDYDSAVMETILRRNISPGAYCFLGGLYVYVYGILDDENRRKTLPMSALLCPRISLKIFLINLIVVVVIDSI